LLRNLKIKKKTE